MINLTELNMLPLYLKIYKKNSQNDSYYFKYAEKLCSEIIGESSLHYLEKLNINKFETIFINDKAFSLFYNSKLKKITNEAYKEQLQYTFLLKEILKGKPVFVCKLLNEKGYYEFGLPEPVCFEIAESTSDNYVLKRIRKKLKKKNSCVKNKKPDTVHMKRIQSYLISVNYNFLLSFINLARRDFDFVERFNNEMFHQNIIYNNKSFSKDEVNNIYETDRFSKIIDLTDTRERIAFISLYGITAKGLKLDDFYSIDGIFSLQPNRERDSLKQISGIEVFKLIMDEDRYAITDIVYLMGEILTKLPLPSLNLNDFNLLKKNYSLYCGISDIGKIFSGIILSDKNKKLLQFQKIAVKLSDYSLIEKYFNFILKNSFEYNHNNNNYIYETLKRFEKAIISKKIASELDYGSKEFKI